MRLLLLLPALLLPYVHAIPIDNGVEGVPEIGCGPSSITIRFNTQNTFEGEVYVKNFYNNPDCITEGRDGSRNTGIDLPFETCGVQRLRSLNPKGVFVWTTVIIKFHPTFVTKVDQAIRIQCFYMEADKTVSQELEVSMLTTGLQTLQVPMPICRYDILEGGPNGDPVRFALVGQQVYHKWTCDSDTRDTFCMVVYGCYVDDGNLDRVQLLDDDGCALDRYLLNNLDYPTDLMAGREAHVFKYADRPNLYFNCQIRITVKEPGLDCERPACPEPAGLGDGRSGGSSSRGRPQPASRFGGRSGGRNFGRKKRDVQPAGILDVTYPHSILVGDVDLTENDVPAQLIHPTRFHNQRRHLQYQQQNGVCMSYGGFTVMTLIGTCFLISTLAMSILICLRRGQKSVV